jgi:hypothetical protein
MSPEQTLIKFFENTSNECLTAVTIVIELLTKYKLRKDEVKQVVENSISAASFLIDIKKKTILLEANLEVKFIYLIYFFVIDLSFMIKKARNEIYDTYILKSLIFIESRYLLRECNIIYDAVLYVCEGNLKMRCRNIRIWGHILRKSKR